MVGTAVRVRDNRDNFSNRLQIDRPAEVAPPVAEAASAFRISSRSTILTIRNSGRESQRFLRTIVRTKFDNSGRKVEAPDLGHDRLANAHLRGHLDFGSDGPSARRSAVGQ
jgi:hypothetical protein